MATAPSRQPGSARETRLSSGRVLLALETTAPVASVAVAIGDEVRATAWLTRRREHAAGLLAWIKSTLEEARVGRGEVEGILVGRGPGSFTGIRIGAATAMGLATGLGVPLYPCSSLMAAVVPGAGAPPGVLPATARGVRAPPPDARIPRYVLFDARSDRVYAACYRVRQDRIVTLVEPWAATIGALLGRPVPDRARFCGDGALRSAARIREAGHPLLPPPYGFPTAEGLVRLHALCGVTPAEARRFEPEYLRSPVTFPSVTDLRGIRE